MSDPAETSRPLDAGAFRELARRVYHRRRLEEGAVGAEQLARIQESARWTPSVANRQPWLLAAASGEAAQQTLREMARVPDGFEDFFEARNERDVVHDMYAAGALIVVMGLRNDPFWRESCLLATYQMMLASAAEGLAARVLMPRSPNSLARLVRIPSEYLAYMVLLLGTPGLSNYETSELKPLSDVTLPLAPPEA